jgi:serine/threonine protein kinase
MTAERWRQITAIYHAAIARAGADRTAYVSSACAGDDDLRRDVESLLAQGESFLAKPVGLPPGSHLGAYELIEVIGAGGMGVVYRALRRGAGAARVSLDEAPVVTDAPDPDVIALSQALDAFARIDERKSRVVELRYFGGLTVEETAEALGISPETVTRDWRIARAWLRRELGGG